MYRAEQYKIPAILFLRTCGAPVRGQVGSGALLGEVRDESSALAPGVKLVAIQDGTNFSRTTGATRESVAVRATVSPIQAHDASVAYRLNAPEILELPL